MEKCTLVCQDSDVGGVVVQGQGKKVLCSSDEAWKIFASSFENQLSQVATHCSLRRHTCAGTAYRAIH